MRRPKKLDTNSLSRRFGSLLDDVVALARRRGCKEPFVYIEGDSGLCVTEGPPHGEDSYTHAEVVVDIGWGERKDRTYRCDVGSW